MMNCHGESLKISISHKAIYCSTWWKNVQKIYELRLSLSSVQYPLDLQLHSLQSLILLMGKISNALCKTQKQN